MYAISSGEKDFDIEPVGDSDDDDDSTPEDDGMGYFSSLKVDENKNVHISHFDAINKKLKYSYLPDGGTWGSLTVEEEVEVTSAVSLDVDSLGNLHLAYVINWPFHMIKYATNEAKAWETYTLYEERGFDPSLVVSEDNEAYISYNGDGRLKAAIWFEEEWGDQIIDPTGGLYTSIALDEQRGLIHFAYFNASSLFHGFIEQNELVPES